MRAPWRDIESFLHDKERWILGKLEQWAGAPRPALLRGISGEGLPLLGRAVVLDVRESAGRAVKLYEGRVVVWSPTAKRALETLVGWLKSKALETLAPRAEHYASRLALPAPCVALSSGRSQWGVCVEDGTIRLNWRLVHLTPELSDYVVAHEVAHLIEMNHSSRFWKIVSNLYPGWRQAKERLEREGAALPLIRAR